MGSTPSPSAELRAQFGEIDIYLFDQLQRGRFDARRRVLDAGCGAGRNLPYFLARGFEIYAIDEDPGAVAAARKLAAPRWRPRCRSDNIRQGALHALPWPDGRMDAVVCSAVLHFARDRTHFERMVDEMWRVLAPGGLFFARLASSIGIEPLVSDTVGRVRLPDGSDRFVVDEQLLLDTTHDLGGTLVDPIKTTNVQNQRCMTTWVIAEERDRDRRSRGRSLLARGDVAVAGADAGRPGWSCARGCCGTGRRRDARTSSRARTGCSAPRRCWPWPASRSAVLRTTSVRPPLWPVISFRVFDVDPLGDRLRLRRVDRDRVDEGVAAHERRAEVVQRGVARGVGAVGDEHDRRALARAVLDEAAARRRSRRRSRCCRSAAASRARRARRRGLSSSRRAARASWLNAITKNASFASSSVEQEALDRRLGVLDAPAEHAVADVEQQAEAERHALVGELRDRQALAVLVDLERLFRQPRDQLPVGVADRGGDHGQLDARAQRRLWAAARAPPPARAGQPRTGLSRIQCKPRTARTGTDSDLVSARRITRSCIDP